MEPMPVEPDCESSLTFELETLKKAPSVVDIWYQASVGRLSQAAPKLTGRFEIHIEIPIGDINIAAASKAIIDGIGCA